MEKDREHKLMIEILKCQVRGKIEPHHLAGQFVYTYHLDLDNQLGTPIPKDVLNIYVGKFLKGKGYEDYDRRKFFAAMGHLDISSVKLSLNGVSTKMYLINPLHKLDEDDND